MVKKSLPWVKDRETPPPFHYKNIASFYASTPWRSLREYKLSISPLCEEDLLLDKMVPAEEVDHIQEIAIRPDLALEITNLRALCKSCHSSKTRKQTNKTKRPQGHIITFKSKFLNNGKENNKPGLPPGEPGIPRDPGRDSSDV